MFNVIFSKNFEKLFESLATDNEKQLILNFLFKVRKKGLFNITTDDFPGKLAKSWSGTKPDNPKHQYAKDNNLWHYHIGFQEYIKNSRGESTSEWMVHFIWKRYDKTNCKEIKLVDYTPHTINGGFPHPTTDKFI